MKVSHCVITFESDEKCTVKNRKNYDFKKDEWKEEGYPVEIPDQFKDLLFCLFSSWLWDYEYDVNKVEFTYARDENLGESISVVNPHDHFSHKVGRERAIGRLRRAAGVLTRTNKKGVEKQYEPHETIPETIILY